MTTRALRPARVLAVLALTAPMAGAFVAVTAAPALAANTIASPASGAVFDSGTGTTVNADLDPCAPTITLKVVNPQHDNSWATQSTKPSACDGLFPPSTRRKPKVSPTWTSTMPNGAFAVYLYSGSTQPSEPTRTFYTNFGPTATPSGVTATGTGASQMDVHWDYTGSEPDLAGFELNDGKGNTFAAGKDDRSFTTYYQNQAPGTYDYHFTVTALRKSGNGGADVKGSPSSAADAQLVTPQPPPPPPSPTPTPTGGTSGSTTGATNGGTTGTSNGGSTGATNGGSTGATNGGSTGAANGGTTGTKPSSGGTTGTAAKPIVVPTLPPLVASRRSFALNFNSFSPSLGIPKLPPLPATSFPVTAGENGLGDVYQPTLPYKSEGKKTTNVLSSPIASITSSLDTTALLRGLAGCLILLAVAAHVRFFMSQPHEE